MRRLVVVMERRDVKPLLEGGSGWWCRVPGWEREEGGAERVDGVRNEGVRSGAGS